MRPASGKSAAPKANIPAKNVTRYGQRSASRAVPRGSDNTKHKGNKFAFSNSGAGGRAMPLDMPKSTQIVKSPKTGRTARVPQ